MHCAFSESDAIEASNSITERWPEGRRAYMTRHERITQAVYHAVDSLNAQLKGKHLDRSPDEPLYGTGSDLDSLDFATFIMEVEDKINKEFGADITIAENDLFLGADGPFATITGVIDYLDQVLEKGDPAHL